MSTIKIGVTENKDPSTDFSWKDNLSPYGNIIITKNLTEELMEYLGNNIKTTILHLTVTGYGGTAIEPNVPTPFETLLRWRKLNKDYLFPPSHAVLRIDPIFPTRLGINMAASVLKLFEDTGIRRLRFSLLDLYPHVIKRFKERNIEIPYINKEFLDADYFLLYFYEKFMAIRKGYFIYNKFNVNYREPDTFKECYYLESCSEHFGLEVGCLSKRDYEILHLPIPKESKSKQRPHCHCLGNGKYELFTKDKRGTCPLGCAYCYWSDKKKG